MCEGTIANNVYADSAAQDLWVWVSLWRYLEIRELIKRMKNAFKCIWLRYLEQQ